MRTAPNLEPQGSGDELGGLDGDTPARTFVETQDREIGSVSGRPRGRIKSIKRARKAKSPQPPPPVLVIFRLKTWIFCAPVARFHAPNPLDDASF